MDSVIYCHSHLNTCKVSKLAGVISVYMFHWFCFQTNGKLFVFDGDEQNWVERGRGLLRLNDMRCDSSQMFQSRLCMYTYYQF